MKVKVGTALAYRGQQCICTRITRQQVELFAMQTSSALREELSRLGNAQYLNLNVEEFAEGELISVEEEWIELTAPGHNVFFIYTKSDYKKGMEADGQQRTETSSRPAGDSQAEAVNQRVEGGASDGSADLGQDGGALHRDGPAGEAGVVGGPGDGEGSQHSGTEHGDSGGSGS